MNDKIKKKTAIIIGAGPAGLTSAYELLHKTDVKPIVFEMTDDVGGLAKTVNYKGNRIDIGGHRFFSKSDRIMEWWTNILPLQKVPNNEKLDLTISYHNREKKIGLEDVGPDPEKEDKVMLIRHRLSRILFLRKFFKYPISLNFQTVKNLGIIRVFTIGFSYIWASLVPIRKEHSLEDFLINRFGRQLYQTFFKDYTEKVWGMPCNEIPAEWGAQRIKGLSIRKAIVHSIKSLIKKDSSIDQKGTETSLIERFLYPKYGPGQMWQEVSRKVESMGGEIHYGWKVVDLAIKGGKVTKVTVQSVEDAEKIEFSGDYFFSTMPVKDLFRALGSDAPSNVRRVAEGLIYRDFITVGLLLRKLKVRNERVKPFEDGLISDNWIYVQEKDVKVGRIQIFNNWSPYMVKDKNTVWLGLEYFCNEGDELWSMSDDKFMKFAIEELVSINFIKSKDVIDSTIIKMPKTYPAYFGSFNEFKDIQNYTDSIPNLFLIGRNGMHRYNNQDHSMLTAMTAVENIINGVITKDNIWAINVEEEYHEEK